MGVEDLIDRKTIITAVLSSVLTALLIGLFINPLTAVINSLFTLPDFRISTSICIPSDIQAKLVNVETGEETTLDTGFPTPFLVSFTNTGNSSLKNFDLFIEFISESKNFITQGDEIHTLPAKGFGNIQIYNEGGNVKRINVELMNPNDRIDFFTYGNLPATAVTYTKVEGLSYYSEITPRCY